MMNRIEDIVTPWDVVAASEEGFDYEMLCEKFGCNKISANLLERLQYLAGDSPIPAMIRRGIFFSHRDLNIILDKIEAKEPFYLYTGRGPCTGSLHLGHLIQFFVTKWFQQTFNCPVIIQMTDDEKYLWKNGISDDEEVLKRITYENIKDIISVGFQKDKTFIFRNSEHMNGSLYWNILKMWKRIDHNEMKEVFGIMQEDNIGKTAFPAMQGAPAFSSSFPKIFGTSKNIPCLIPCAIDQDPFFQMTRKIAPKIGYEKPNLIYSAFLPSLQGPQNKMSGSDSDSCIRLSDSLKEINEKIMNSFCGEKIDNGGGGKCDIIVAYQFLRCFEENDALIEEVKEKYANGEMLPEDIKTLAMNTIQKIIDPLQKCRKTITDENVQEFAEIRPLNFNF